MVSKLGFTFLIFYSLAIIRKTAGDDPLSKIRFPEEFYFGVASASYQVEGAWNEDGKGESNWDAFTHTVPSPILNNDTGDIACDTYHKYEEDIVLLKELHVKHYRISIAWTRLIPTGFGDKVNTAGITYYKNLIKLLKDNGIEPMVTIFHWDTPQALEEIGGWTNDLIIDKFVTFADICFKNFGDDVKYWTTFNEPHSLCYLGYGTGTKAPGTKSPGIASYLCAHNLIKAHAKVWHLYDESYRPTQEGLVGIPFSSAWYEPKNDTNDDDIDAAERQMQFTLGWYANPVVYGDYPDVMKEYIGNRSDIQGFPKSRLPTFTEEEQKYIKNTLDYIAINYYTAVLVENKIDEDITDISWSADSQTSLSYDSSWESSASDWLKVTPWGLKNLLLWLNQTYPDYSIIVTENGYSDDGSTLTDDRRIYYYEQHLSKVREAMIEGVDVFGYTAWSFMDNFEWERGYSERFGIYSVDFNDPNRTRTPKKSVDYIKHVFTTRCIVNDAECSDE